MIKIILHYFWTLPYLELFDAELTLISGGGEGDDDKYGGGGGGGSYI